jgi:hypothetical protein
LLVEVDLEGDHSARMLSNQPQFARWR